MGPRSIIGALLVLTATAGDSTSTTSSLLTSNGSSGAGSGPSSSLVNIVIEEPEFTEVIENVTVPAGRNVKLGCSVKNLGSYKVFTCSKVPCPLSNLPALAYLDKQLLATPRNLCRMPPHSYSLTVKVAWMHFEQSAILTVHNHVITRNPRISVTHDKHDKHRTWYLHINNVHEEDKGRYMCQINTVAAKTQFGYLHVVVPPNIDDSFSSSDVIVREGSNISLRCRATGSPTPTVKWKRDDNSKISINKSFIVNEWDGDVLEITRISRLDMGAYLCIASNGVPPTVSKRIKVSVDFPPMLLIPHQLVGAPEGYNVSIECFTEAHPTSLNYWTRGEGPIIHDSQKYKVESTIGMPSYKTHMKLTILSVSNGDDGMYKCVAKNPRGETDGTIRLYVSNPPTTSPGLLTSDNHLDNSGHNLNTKSVHHIGDKNTRYQSNLNDIGLSEHKSSVDKTLNGGAVGAGGGVGQDGYNWPAIQQGQDANTNLRNQSNRLIRSTLSYPPLIRWLLFGFFFHRISCIRF